MNWELFLGLSLAILFLSVLTSVRQIIQKRDTARLFSPVNILFAGTFLATFFALFPVFRETLRESFPGISEACLQTVHATLQVFTINADRGMISIIQRSAGRSGGFYAGYVSVLYTLAPLLTFGFLFSLFSSLNTRIRYLIHWFSDVYVFSEMNGKSLSLAGSLKANHPGSVIVFFGSEESADQWKTGARKLGALLFDGDPLSVPLSRHASRAKINFFAISEDETRNTDLALRLTEAYRERENTSVYTFAADTESELMLANMEKGKVQLRRLNEARSLIYHRLYNEGEKLFEHALAAEGKDERKISAVILGLGRYGIEMLKALTWYGQMDGYSITIDAFDRDPLAGERFSLQCPELASEKFNGVMNPDDARYTIRIHSGVDVASAQFVREMEQLRDTTYALVCLGSDKMNLETAAALRQQFERMKPGHRPVLQAVICDAERKKALQGLKNFRSDAYDIAFIGDTESLYTEDVIVNSALEQEALKGHLMWGEEKDFWNYEYNYRSSMAVAIHRKAREKCGMPGARKTEGQLTEKERDALELLEHRRWNAYMRSEGYIFSGSTDPRTRNDLGKMHPSLTGFSRLSKSEKRKDSRIGSRQV